MRIPVADIWSLFLHILFSPAGKAFTISLISWLLIFQYCHIRYWREPHSAFFHSEHVYDFKYTQYRRAQAKYYIDRAKGSRKPAQKAGTHPEICAALTTVKRDGEQYIDLAVGSMLVGLTKEERSKLFAYVMFANVDPNVHPSFKAPWLRNAVDVVGGYNISEEVRTYLWGLEEKKDFREKGVFDYVYALEYCYNTQAPYIAILEGDIIFADGWMSKTLNSLREIEAKASTKSAPFYNWLYFRLFYSETFIQWESADFLWGNRRFIIISAMLLGFTILVLSRSYLPSTRRHLDNYTLSVLCLLTIPAFTAFIYMLGRNTYNPVNSVFTMNMHGCCSQALVFPRSQVLDLVTYLKERKAGQTDMIIEDYATKKGNNRLAIRPQIVQHVGRQSSRDNGAVDTQSVWGFWFEELDPGVLKRGREGS